MRHLVLVASGVLVLSACGGSDAPATAATAASVEAPNGVTDFGEFSQDHVDVNVEYEQDPPVGGAHFGAWQTCDFYEAPIANEQGVHSMEHGAVWITFAPDLADDERAAIKELADGTREVLASPYEGLPSPVVASAWGLQAEFDSALDSGLAEFVDFYENGPQTPELNTPCAGGTS